MGPKQPVMVNGIEFDAILDGTSTYSASVPTYPIDAGYSVSDNVALDPFKLSMVLYVTATPVTWLSRHGTGEERIRLICDSLVELYSSREMLSVVTQDKAYDNMVIQNLEIKQSEEIGYAREIALDLVQVTVTAASVQTVPAEYLRSGKSMQSTGTASNSSVGIAGQYGTGEPGESSNTDSGSNSGDPYADLWSGGSWDPNKTLWAGLADSGASLARSFGIPVPEQLSPTAQKTNQQATAAMERQTGQRVKHKTYEGGVKTRGSSQ